MECGPTQASSQPFHQTFTCRNAESPGPIEKFNVPKLSLDDADFANIFGSDGHLLCIQETLVCLQQGRHFHTTWEKPFSRVPICVSCLRKQMTTLMMMGTTTMELMMGMKTVSVAIVG